MAGDSRTYCTGYWHVSDNKKRDQRHYVDLIPQTLSLIPESNLILYFKDEWVLDLFEREAEKNKIQIKPYRIFLEELPAYKYSAQLLASCKAMELDADNRPSRLNREKGILHYWRDYMDAGEDVYRQLITIWMSKVPLIANDAVVKNPFLTDNFVWIDASIARIQYKRKHWNFSNAYNHKDKLVHYSSKMNFHGSPLPVSAGFMLANRWVWSEINRLFWDTWMEQIETKYAHDEETILSLCFRKRPDLFYELGKPLPKWRVMVEREKARLSSNIFYKYVGKSMLTNL